MVAPPLMTADELLRLHMPDKRTELVRGVLVVREPAGYRHGKVTAELTKLPPHPDRLRNFWHRGLVSLISRRRAA